MSDRNHPEALAKLVAEIERQCHGAYPHLIEASLKRAVDAYIDGPRRALEVEATFRGASSRTGSSADRDP